LDIFIFIYPAWIFFSKFFFTCAKCGGSGEIITPKRNDPKVDEALEDIMRLSGKERTDEGKMSEIHQGAN
jgi:hypothetical protein